jgi:hypothetical protein
MRPLFIPEATNTYTAHVLTNMLYLCAAPRDFPFAVSIRELNFPS